MGSFNAVVTTEANSISADFRKLRKVCSFCIYAYIYMCVYAYMYFYPSTWADQRNRQGIYTSVYNYSYSLIIIGKQIHSLQIRFANIPFVLQCNIRMLYVHT